jgi:hypothetical protein
VDLKFCQVAFHVLFCTDFYLEAAEDTVRDQDFHRANLDAFHDYKELGDRKRLSLKLKLDTGEGVEWVGSDWSDE